MLDYIIYFLTTVIGAFFGSFIANYILWRRREPRIDLSLSPLTVVIKHDDVVWSEGGKPLDFRRDVSL